MYFMKAVVKDKPERGISVCNMPVPAAGPGEVIIKVRMAGICGTDLHIYNWDDWAKNRVKVPVIIGHEFIGEIVDMGPGVVNLKTGQRVSGEGHITCGHCRYCRNGNAHICQDVKIVGVDRNGCFSEYLCIPASNVWPVRDSIPDKYGTLFDPIGNAMHTVMSQPVNMKAVLITGAGSIGLFAVAITKSNGAARVIVLEPNPYKRELAAKIGADLVIDSSDPGAREKIIDATDGNGPDVLLEMSGHPGALRMGLDLLSNGGTASLLGIPEREVPINVAGDIVFKGITIHGITGRRIFETWYQCESFLLKEGHLIEPVITHKVTLDNIEESFLSMKRGEAVKVLVEVGV
ncbi:MAG: L-threonine 3-dehydrogenase [Clostridiaceae bacterium]|nr:L-threonine 3-dehydrogenase [Clostridiaceae bacterium]